MVNVLSAQEAVNILCDYFLGEDWYIVDPVRNDQANAIIVEEIKNTVPSKYNKDKFLLYRKKHPRCKYCKYFETIELPDKTILRCNLKEILISKVWFKGRFCRWYVPKNRKKNNNEI